MKVKKQQLEQVMEQKSGPKLGKEYVILFIYFYAELIMGNTRLNESQDGVKVSRKNINNIRDGDDINNTLMEEIKEELESLLTSVGKESEKANLKLNIQKQRSWHLVPSLHDK